MSEAQETCKDQGPIHEICAMFCMSFIPQKSCLKTKPKTLRNYQRIGGEQGDMAAECNVGS